MKNFKYPGKLFFIVAFNLLAAFLLLEMASRLFLVDHLQTKIWNLPEHYAHFANVMDETMVDLSLTTPVRIPHPYFSYVDDTDSFESQENYFGEDYTRSDVPETFRLGVFGASVAEQALAEEKKTGVPKNHLVPAIKGKDGTNIELIDFTVSGSRQPQTNIINSLYHRGIDASIIIDGFNEIANRQVGFAPYFPMAVISTLYYSNMLEEGVTSEYLELVYKRRARLRKLQLTAYPFRALKTKDLFLYLRETVRQIELDKILLKNGRRSFGGELHYGPPSTYEKIYLWLSQACFQQNMMHEQGKPALFFLQPFPGLYKELTGKEQELLTPYLIARHKLIEAMSVLEIMDWKALRARTGLNLISLLKLFENEKRTVYKDGCCHLKPLGNSLLLKEVGRKFAEYRAKKVYPRCELSQLKKLLDEVIPHSQRG